MCRKPVSNCVRTIWGKVPIKRVRYEKKGGPKIKRKSGSLLPLIQFIGFTMVTLFGLEMFKFYLNDFPEYGFDSQTVSISEALNKQIEVCRSLLDAESQASAILRNDRLDKLLKSGLQPIQARLSSLKVQTRQYEKMNLTPGNGPAFFIASSLQELNAVENTWLPELLKSADVLIDKNAQLIKTLEDILLEFVEVGLKTLANDELSEVGVQMRCSLSSSHKNSKDYDERDRLWRCMEKWDQTNVTLVGAIDALKSLAFKFQVFENNIQKFYDHCEFDRLNCDDFGLDVLDKLDQPNSTEIENDPVLSILKSQKDDLQKEIERNSKLYQMTIPLSLRQFEKVSSLLTRASKAVKQAKGSSIFQLQRTIANDVKKLKKRLYALA